MIEFDAKKISENELLKNIKSKGYDGHIIKEINIKTEDAEKKKSFKKLRNKVLSSSLAGMAFLGSYLADYDKIYEGIKSPKKETVSIEKSIIKNILTLL